MMMFRTNARGQHQGTKQETNRIKTAAFSIRMTLSRIFDGMRHISKAYHQEAQP
jgi:hypothetical protein